MSTEFRLLGPLEVLADGTLVKLGGPRPRAVLAVLLLHAGQVVSTTRLIDEVWAEVPPDTAANILQGHVSQLRKELGRDTIETATRDMCCASITTDSISGASSDSWPTEPSISNEGASRMAPRFCGRRSSSGAGPPAPMSRTRGC